MCLKWLKKIHKKLDIWDIGLIKIGAFCFGLLVGAYFASYLLPYLWLLLVITVLSIIRPCYRSLK